VSTVDLTKGVHPRGIERPWLTIAVVLKARWEWSDAAFVYEKIAIKFYLTTHRTEEKEKKKSE
jgi:hypothetical protein